MILALGTEGQTIWASEPRITMPILNNNPAFGWLLVPQPPGSGIAAGWPMGFESGGGVWPMNTVVEEPSFITPKAGRFLDSNSGDSRLDLVGPVSSKPAGDGSVNFEPVKSKPIDFQLALKAKPAVGGMPESKPGNESRSRVSVDDGAAKALQPESMPGHGRADSKSVNDTEDGPLLDSIKKDKESEHCFFPSNASCLFLLFLYKIIVIFWLIMAFMSHSVSHNLNSTSALFLPLCLPQNLKCGLLPSVKTATLSPSLRISSPKRL